MELTPAARYPGFDARTTGRLMAAAFAVSANSEWTRREILLCFKEPPSAVDVVYYGSAVGGAPAMPSGDLPPKPFILCAARLAEYKGLDVLVLAFAELAERYPEIRLILCGSDHSNGGLQRFIRSLGLEDRVLWLGQKRHEDLLALIKECLFFVLPSRRDSLGGAIIEAMQSGKAVVATEVGGIPELIRDGIEGLLVKPKDVDGLARAMERLVVDGSLRERLGHAGRLSSGKFSWEKAIETYSEIYRRHPSAERGLKTICVFWDRSADATAAAYAGNLARGMSRRETEFCIGLRRANWSESFRIQKDGWTLYHLGLPSSPLGSLIDPGIVFFQLLWIRYREKASMWHFFLIRYKQLGPLLWFARWTDAAPVVSLC